MCCCLGLVPQNPDVQDIRVGVVGYDVCHLRNPKNFKKPISIAAAIRESGSQRDWVFSEPHEEGIGGLSSSFGRARSLFCPSPATRTSQSWD